MKFSIEYLNAETGCVEFLKETLGEILIFETSEDAKKYLNLKLIQDINVKIVPVWN